jgi:3-oxoacyl-[acyl-carrier-protein] synthase III
MVNAEIVAFGRYVPERILDNQYFIDRNPYKVYTGRDTNGDPIFAPEKKVLTLKDILKATGGVEERRMCAPGETVLDLIERAYINCGFPASELRGIIIGTVSYEPRFPSAACVIQERIGAKNAKNVIDIGAACSGFTHGLHYANLAVKAGEGPYLIVGAETLRRIVDEEEVNSDLFGDGCGLVVVAPGDGLGRGIITTELASDSSGLELIYKDKLGKLRMPSGRKGAGGQEVFKRATKGMVEMAHRLVEKSEINERDIKLYIPHQANGRIIEHIEGVVDPGKVGRIYWNIKKYGNMSAATVPFALGQAVETGRAKRGDLVVLVDMGGGLSFGGALIRI